MDFRQLEIFAAVVEEGGFSRAGDKLFLTQPTVSAHINGLENELGQRLLERGGKEVRPTESGKRFYGYARRMLALRAEALAAMHGEDHSGTIDIAASSVPAQYLLPGLIGGYHQLHPEINFNILRTDSGGVSRMVSDGQVELGLSGSKITDDACVYQPIAEDRLILILPDRPEYRSLLKTPADVATLLRQPMICREPGSGTRREFEKYLRRVLPQLQLRIIAEMDDQDSIKRAVAAGLGVAVISERAAEDYIRLGQILAYPLEEAGRSLYLVRRRKHILSSRVADFANYLLRELQP